MFHLNSNIAATKVALAHEALGTMICDCLYYQVDFIGGDANMALYRAGGRKQESQLGLSDDVVRAVSTHGMH